MNQAVLEGFGVGLMLSGMIGPVFFSLVQGSILHGFRYALLLALGVLFSDFFYVVVTYFGVEVITAFSGFEQFLGYVGGLVLIGFGLRSLLKRANEIILLGEELPRVFKKREAFLKGFGINGINPFVLLFWISIASGLHLKEHFSEWMVVGYFSVILGTVFGIDLLKALLARKSGKWMTPRLIGYLNKVVGVLIIGFGLKMFWMTLGKYIL
ncbi:LysE family translocator [Algoriphagus sp. CAU 1675]|uniref:LysE family translocator n=1 Tax=Algoriphagus sp. CAU 1675 TaxID=3032597 RepID=UPI0023DA4963|nr:LysE family translocator [Algoriphagus sp. CAU 1675]MDF2159342.1 LysE family translocator [Algoriphagus sp. CAU 1675]